MISTQGCIVVTLNHRHKEQRIQDFCFCNRLTRTQQNKAINNITGDTYYFYAVESDDDAYALAGLQIHSYIHLDPLPNTQVINYYLFHYIRRPHV